MAPHRLTFLWMRTARSRRASIMRNTILAVSIAAAILAFVEHRFRLRDALFDDLAKLVMRHRSQRPESEADLVEQWFAVGVLGACSSTPEKALTTLVPGSRRTSSPRNRLWVSRASTQPVPFQTGNSVVEQRRLSNPVRRYVCVAGGFGSIDGTGNRNGLSWFFAWLKSGIRVHIGFNGKFGGN